MNLLPKHDSGLSEKLGKLVYLVGVVKLCVLVTAAAGCTYFSVHATKHRPGERIIRQHAALHLNTQKTLSRF